MAKDPIHLLIKYTMPAEVILFCLRRIVMPPLERTPLSMKWWDMKGRIPFDVRPAEKSPAGWYRFTAPPGLRRMTIRADGKINVFVDGDSESR